MNKFAIIFLLLFFLAAILIGVFAVRDRLTLTGQSASPKCPKQTLPSPGACPQNQNPKLIKDEKGCYSFICQ